MYKQYVTYNQFYKDYTDIELYPGAGISRIAHFNLEYDKDQKKGLLRISAGAGQADGEPKSSEQKKWVTDIIERLSIDAKEDWGVNWHIYGQDSVKKWLRPLKNWGQKKYTEVLTLIN